MRVLCLLAVLIVLVATSEALAAEPATPRVGVRVLPFSGVVIPHQDISDNPVGPALGLGLEVYYMPSFSFSVDVTTSFHPNLRVSSLQLLGRWRFLRDGWTPFLQASLGGYQAEDDSGDREDQFGGPGGSFGGGVEVPVWRSVLVQGEVRSNWVRGFESAGNDKRWIGHTQLFLWLVYKLP